jgi:hypothetical protein
MKLQIRNAKRKTILGVAAFAFLLLPLGNTYLSSNISSISSAFVFGPQPISAGFLNGTIGTAHYFKNFECRPSAQKLLGISKHVSNFVSGCEVGAAGQEPPKAGALWILVPAYAGLSIFGAKSLGATSQGFPTFQGKVVKTDCAAGTTASACPDHPSYTYSPAFVAVEQYLNITKGIFGLPEGVLPTPAHTHIITTPQPSAWYVITVLVFDPNIMPNPANGKCHQVVDSNLTNPTGNCLTSFTNLYSALTNATTAVSNANTNNPIWKALGMPMTQVIIPGDNPQTISNPNSNIILFFNVTPGNPYKGQNDQTATTITA